MRILGIIITTFFIAIVYGFCLTTMDFLEPNYNPVNAGRQAADNVYGLFGTIGGEIKRNDADRNEHAKTIAEKIATPYAITADLSAIVAGKIEINVTNLVHSLENRA